MKQTPTRPTARESAAAQRLAEALLEFMVANEEGRAERRALRPRDEIAVRVEQAPPPHCPREPDPEPPSDSAGGDRRLLSAREAAEYLSIGERLLWTLTAPSGPLPVVRLGRILRYPVADLDAAIQRMQLKPRKDRPA